MRRAMAVMWAVSVSVLIACAGRPVSVPAKPPPGVGSVQVTSGGYSGDHVVGITVGVPGSVASGAVSRDGNRGGTSSGCDQACQQHSQMCTGQNPLVFDPSQPHGSAQWQAFLQAIGCAAAPAGAGPPPPPTAAQLAQWAYGQLRLPAPVPARYPSGTLGDGRPYTIVKTHMWFSTDAGAWHPVSKTVCAGALCATATAKPSWLSFDPGNGDASVSCPGPGTRFRQSGGGSWVPGRQPQGCDYQYLNSTYGRSEWRVDGDVHDHLDGGVDGHERHRGSSESDDHGDRFDVRGG